jgi:hypothetical protein
MASFNGLGRNDKIFLGAGALAFIFTFIAFAHISIQGFGGDTVSAWHGIGTLASLLLLASVVVAAIVAMSPSTMPSLPVGPRMVAVGLAALAFIFFIIRWVTLPGGDVLGHHYGYSLYWGGYVLLVLNIIMIVVGLQSMRAAGEAMPWEGGSSRTPPAAPPPAAPPTA